MAKIPVMKKVQQIRTLSALWKYRSQLFRMLREMLRGTYKASFLTIVALVAGLIYIISPIDILPDFIPLIGWMDDGFIMYFLLKRLMYELQRYEQGKPELKLIRKS